jgi:hypothetical protein
MKLLSLLPLALALPLSAQISKTDSDFVAKTYVPSTALLYAQNDGGDMKMRCTATAIEKNEKGYVFVTAAHCGCVDDTDESKVTAEKTFFYITADGEGGKEFLKAKPIACGYRHAGDDFLLFQVDTKEAFGVIPLGDDPRTMDVVVNVASPLGLGKQVFVGSVSAAKLDRPVVQDDIDWTNAILLQLFGTDGGSSGSSVVCLDQKAICAFVVGSIDKTTITAMPVSRLVKLRKQVADGKYKYWKADEK